MDACYTIEWSKEERDRLFSDKAGELPVAPPEKNDPAFVELAYESFTNSYEERLVFPGGGAVIYREPFDCINDVLAEIARRLNFDRDLLELGMSDIRLLAYDCIGVTLDEASAKAIINLHQTLCLLLKKKSYLPAKILASASIAPGSLYDYLESVIPHTAILLEPDKDNPLALFSAGATKASRPVRGLTDIAYNSLKRFVLRDGQITLRQCPACGSLFMISGSHKVYCPYKGRKPGYDTCRAYSDAMSKKFSMLNHR